MTLSAFIFRMSPGGTDMVPDALAADQIIIGWSEAEGLLDPRLSWEEFREIIRETYYSKEPNLRKAGAAAGHMWRFIREMKAGDLIVVPYGTEFYVAKILGEATYDPAKAQDDSAYRRSVEWLNNKKPIPRHFGRSALLSRMKTQGTCAYATDLLEDIAECLRLGLADESPSFQSDLQSRLIQQILDEIRGGRMDSFGFERLIQTVLQGLGAVEARIIPRSHDKGADILATFRVAGAFQQKVAVQAKHWQPDPPVGAEEVEQLIRGIEAESANLGMVVTSGTISEEAYRAAEEYFNEKGILIELVDGEQFAKLVVEHGVRFS